MKYNSNENKTYCKSFKKCKEIFKIGDYIVAQIKTNIHARIEKVNNFYFFNILFFKDLF